MGWVTVAEGTSFSELQQQVADMNLPKGTKIRVLMDTNYSWLFDLAGAEWAVKPFVPDGVDLIDVYGEGGKGIVDMEADPIYLVPLLTSIARWGIITIAVGFILYTIVSFIRIMVWGPAAEGIPIALIAGLAIGIIGVLLLTRSRAPPRKGG